MGIINNCNELHVQLKMLTHKYETHPRVNPFCGVTNVFDTHGSIICQHNVMRDTPIV